jgi:predicted transposase YbfD/YdcC
MDNTVPYSNDTIRSFIEALDELTDSRDNRGKRHSLPFVISSVVLAILIGRSKVSSIFRYIRNKIEWLRDVSKIDDATPISRAHLPRLLEKIDWTELNGLIAKYFGVHLELRNNKEWVAIDGKTLKGTVKSGNKQAVVFAVTHESRKSLAQAKMMGPKSSEIPVVRELLKDSGLEKGKVTLDAHHCNPTTTSQINQAGGTYLIQVKENQPFLLKECKKLSAEGIKVGNDYDIEKEHGRITTRQAELFSMNTLKLDSRWAKSGFQTLVVVERETFDMSTENTSIEKSYYITNQQVENNHTDTIKELSRAVRKHWSVESNNWIRDVTFNEDKIITKSGNQAQIMSTLRSLAISILRKSGVKNFQEAIENFTDNIDRFESMLRKIKFL